jgi:hypothetical protein
MKNGIFPISKRYKKEQSSLFCHNDKQAQVLSHPSCAMAYVTLRTHHQETKEIPGQLSSLVHSLVCVTSPESLNGVCSLMGMTVMT